MKYYAHNNAFYTISLAFDCICENKIREVIQTSKHMTNSRCGNKTIMRKMSSFANNMFFLQGIND